MLAKLAKSVLEQNGDLFVEACQKYKNEAYFNECANTIKEWNFSANEGEEFSKESWHSLYKVALLLTEEYYATKCDLPKVEAFECKDNDDNASKLEIIAVLP
ncbi:MAG: hypothetical protein FWC26_05465 [Fibromonadales bacterium]|nr:hypothetical protein [Fibromonadales bacterium]